MGKESKKTFVDFIYAQSKKVPGVGKYNPHISLDKIARPMKTKGHY